LKTGITYIESSKVPFFNRFTTYRNQVQYFKGFCEEVKPDFLLFNTNNFFLLKKAYELRKKYGYRTVLDIRTIPVTHSRLRSPVENYFFGKSVRFAASDFDGITYVTEKIREYCKKKFKLPEHKSSI